MPRIQAPNPTNSRSGDDESVKFSPLLMLRGAILTYAVSHDDALKRVLSRGYSVMPDIVDQLVEIEKTYQDEDTVKYKIKDKKTGITAEAIVRPAPSNVPDYITAGLPRWMRLLLGYPGIDVGVYEVTIYNHTRN